MTMAPLADTPSSRALAGCRAWSQRWTSSSLDSLVRSEKYISTSSRTSLAGGKNRWTATGLSSACTIFLVESPGREVRKYEKSARTSRSVAT